MSQRSQEQFLRDVAEHQMTILRDDGVYRHIRFRRPDSGSMYFDLITWPGYLCYTGDMGTFVFQRLRDMFEFFRTDRLHAKDSELCINECYWSEKLQAVDGGRNSENGATRFSSEKLRRVINKQRLDWVRENRHDTTEVERRELWERIDDEVLYYIDDDGGTAAYSAASDFSFKTHSGVEFEFVDLWDYDYNEFTSRFIWCCYALAWGIARYDEKKGGE